MQFNYSIVIPHRNSPELLQRAIKSIPDRNDIQILVIDNSPQKIEFNNLGINRLNRINLLYSDANKGAGHARNVGLKEAKGKWLLFLDADDFFTPNAFEHFDKYCDSDFDIIYFSVDSVYPDTMNSAKRHVYYANLITEFINGNKNSENNLRNWFTIPVAKLIRNKLIRDNNIYFEEIPAANDLIFSVKSGYFAKKICADKFPVYCITVTEGSLTRLKNKKNERSRYCAAIRQYKFMSSIGKPDQRFNLMSMILKSFKFGPNEFIWYLSKAYQEKVNIFLGIYQWPVKITRFAYSIFGITKIFSIRNKKE